MVILIIVKIFLEPNRQSFRVQSTVFKFQDRYLGTKMTKNAETVNSECIWAVRINQLLLLWIISLLTRKSASTLPRSFWCQYLFLLNIYFLLDLTFKIIIVELYSHLVDYRSHQRTHFRYQSCKSLRVSEFRIFDSLVIPWVHPTFVWVNVEIMAINET